MNPLHTLEIMQKRLDAAAGAHIDILPVTKFRTPEQINPLIAAGHCAIGENRVQEWLDKRGQIDPRVQLHQIGRLQTNKVKYIADHVSMIQSLDREDLLHEIHKQAERWNRVIDVLVQVNPAKEPQKGGVLPENLDAFVELTLETPCVRLRGLMLIAPAAPDPETVAPLFAQTRSLFESLQPHCGEEFSILSMGMSHDALVAAREGATMVRLGTILFTDSLELEE